jgi:hypothetical protein
VLFGVARLDPSGRLSTHGLVRAVGWRSGQRLDLVAVERSIVVTASTTGPCMVITRGEVSLPAAARAWTGIGSGAPVLLTADTTRGRLAVHSAAVVARLLVAVQARGGDDVG